MKEERSAGADRRGLVLAVAGCAAAAGVLLIVSGQPWLEVALPAQPPLPAVRQTLTGQEVVDSVVPIGILVAAGGLALIATRRVGRLVVAATLVVAGLLATGLIGFFLLDDGRLEAERWAQTRQAAGQSLSPDRDLSAVPAVLAVAAGGLAVAVGVFVILRSWRWPVMGARYERTRSGTGRVLDSSSTVDSNPGGDEPPAADEAVMWSALERGEDPTLPSSKSPSHEAAKPPDQPVPGR